MSEHVQVARLVREADESGAPNAPDRERIEHVVGWLESQGYVVTDLLGDQERRAVLRAQGIDSSPDPEGAEAAQLAPGSATAEDAR